MLPSQGRDASSILVFRSLYADVAQWESNGIVNRRSVVQIHPSAPVKKTIIFSFLTIVLIFLVIFEGIPFLIRMITLLGEFKSSTELIEKKDVTPPFPPKLHPLPEATNSAEILLMGFSEPGSTVKVFLNNEVKKEVVAASDGTFITDEFNLSLGKNRIKAKAIDQIGNKSKDSGIITINYDKTKPNLKIKEPKDNQSFSGDQKKVTISGKTEPEASLRINKRLVILGQSGEFSYVLDLNEGENKI